VQPDAGVVPAKAVPGSVRAKRHADTVIPDVLASGYSHAEIWDTLSILLGRKENMVPPE